MSKVNYDFKDGNLNVGVDFDEDGEKSLKLEMCLSEALQESIARGESASVETNKIVDVKFELTKMIVIVDSDKDGEKLLKLTVDLPEAFSEVSGSLFKLTVDVPESSGDIIG